MNAQVRTWPGHFPAAADPATHLAAVPYARTLGFVWEGADAEGARIRMPLNAANATAQGRVDPLAVLGLLDHSCSASVYLALERPCLIATIDLRCEFAADADEGGAVFVQARTLHLSGGFALVRAQACCANSGRAVAYASSTYAIGSHPGMQDKPADTPPLPTACEPDAPDGTEHGLARVLGLQAQAGAWSMPFRRRLVGALSLPAVHGGATAAALLSVATRLAHEQLDPATTWRPLSVDVHYLRAVESVHTLLSPRLRKRGRRSCVISASATQGTPPREAAYAECLLART